MTREDAIEILLTETHHYTRDGLADISDEVLLKWAKSTLAAERRWNDATGGRARTPPIASAVMRNDSNPTSTPKGSSMPTPFSHLDSLEHIDENDRELMDLIKRFDEGPEFLEAYHRADAHLHGPVAARNAALEYIRTRSER